MAMNQVTENSNQVLDKDGHYHHNLSYYVVMTVITFNISTRLNTPKHLEPIDGIKFWDILYADDTLVFGSYTPHLNKTMKEIEIEPAYYNMKLSYDKCIINPHFPFLGCVCLIAE